MFNIRIVEVIFLSHCKSLTAHYLRFIKFTGRLMSASLLREWVRRMSGPASEERVAGAQERRSLQARAGITNFKILWLISKIVK